MRLCLRDDLFEEQQRSAWIRTRTKSEFGEISYSKFFDIEHNHSEFLLTIGKQMAQRLRETARKVSDLAFFDVTVRVARALLHLSKQPDAISHPDGMQIKITRQDIGRIVACSREMVNRVLKELESNGQLSVSAKTMVVYGAR